MDEHLSPAIREAISFLDQQGIQYALIGGIALSQWGVNRYTHDVDIKVLVPEVNYASIREKIRKAFPDRAREQVPQNPLIVAVYIQEVVVDFLLALPGYEEFIIKRAVQRDFGGWLTWVCMAEDLIIQKVVAGRGKDWLDVEGLLTEQYGKLDKPYIEEWLRQFAEVLENELIIPRYKELCKKADQLFAERSNK